MKIHVEVTQEQYKALQRIRDKEGWSINKLACRAIQNFITIKKAAKNEQDTQ